MGLKRGAGTFLSLPSLLLLCCIFLAAGVQGYKYEAFFYWYNRPDIPQHPLSYFNEVTCNETLDAYRQAASSPTGHFNGTNSVELCYVHEDCLLDSIRASWMANYQSAAVILGIMPTLLASLGPRISEISLLSTHRPLLSFLLSVGAPAVWPQRMFEYDDPAESLGKGLNHVVFPKLKSAQFSVALSILQYLLAMAAIVNMMEIAIELGQKTILAWSCTFDWGPLLWSLIPIVIHGLAAIMYNVEIRRAQRRVRNSIAQDGRSTEPNMPVLRSYTFITERAEKSWWRKELKICANQPKGMADLLKQIRVSKFTVLFNCASSVAAFVHLVFGTLLFSSLIFISVWDILNKVLWRYIVSTVVCRLILLMEIAGMRDEQRLKVQSHENEDTHGGVMADRKGGTLEEIQAVRAT